MKKLLFSALFLAASSISFGQSYFDNTYSYGIGTSVCPLTNGEYVTSVNYPNYGFLRINNDGSEQSFTPVTYATMQCIRQTLDGGLVFTGMNLNNQNAVVVKTNEFGDTLWMRNFPPFGFAATTAGITLLPDSGYMINMSSNGALSANPYGLIRLDKDGNTVWSNLLGDAVANIHSFTVDGNYVYDAFTTTYHDEVDIIRLAKVNATSGNTEWTSFLFDTTYMSVGFPCFSYTAKSSCVINGLEMIVAGSKTLKEDPMSGVSYQFLFRTDANGNIVWQKTFSEGEFTQVITTRDNGLMVIGKNANSSSFLMMKLSQNGDSLWSYSFKKGDDAVAKNVEQTSDNGYVVSGSAYTSSNNNYMTYVVRTNENGQTADLINSNLAPSALSEISLYPTVLTDKSTLHVNAMTALSGLHAALYDANGKVVRRFKITSENTEINRDNLAAGAYMLSVSNGFVSQIVVQ
ncbi:MAG: T9SS type A sorting domain-containing protein [Bacteroidia bacterium]